MAENNTIAVTALKKKVCERIAVIRKLTDQVLKPFEQQLVWEDDDSDLDMYQIMSIMNNLDIITTLLIMVDHWRDEGYPSAQEMLQDILYQVGTKGGEITHDM